MPPALRVGPQNAASCLSRWRKRRHRAAASRPGTRFTAAALSWAAHSGILPRNGRRHRAAGRPEYRPPRKPTATRKRDRRNTNAAPLRHANSAIRYRPTCWRSTASVAQSCGRSTGLSAPEAFPRRFDVLAEYRQRRAFVRPEYRPVTNVQYRPPLDRLGILPHRTRGIHAAARKSKFTSN
jgi:hypothetical protein